MRTVVQILLRGYKRWVSPMFLPACRYVPTCSDYAMEAVVRHGVLRGGAMAVWRLLRCNPFAHGGLDLVPEECSQPHQAQRAPEISPL